MDLFTYYNLSETVNSDSIISVLESMSDDLKINYIYNSDNETIKLEDIDLTDDDICFLQNLFEQNDVLPDLDCGDFDDDLLGFDGDYDF